MEREGSGIIDIRGILSRLVFSSASEQAIDIASGSEKRFDPSHTAVSEFFVPEGQLKIAQPFMAGKTVEELVAKPRRGD